MEAAARARLAAGGVAGGRGRRLRRGPDQRRLGARPRPDLRGARRGRAARARAARLRLQRLGRQVPALRPRRRDPARGSRRLLGSRCFARRTSCSRAARSTATARGTLLTTETCLLNPNRGRGRARASRWRSASPRWLGARSVLWLGDGHRGRRHRRPRRRPRALRRRRAPSSRAVEHDASDANAAPLAENLRRLRGMRDAAGKPLAIATLPMPPAARVARPALPGELRELLPRQRRGARPDLRRAVGRARARGPARAAARPRGDRRSAATSSSTASARSTACRSRSRGSADGLLRKPLPGRRREAPRAGRRGASHPLSLAARIRYNMARWAAPPSRPPSRACGEGPHVWSKILSATISSSSAAAARGCARRSPRSRPTPRSRSRSSPRSIRCAATPSPPRAARRPSRAPDDILEMHGFDTVKGSDFLGDQDVIRVLRRGGAQGADAARALGLPVEPQRRRHASPRAPSAA